MVVVMVLFILLCSASASASATTISPHKSGASFLLSSGTNTSVLLSPSKIFAFGFNNIPNGYAVCIFINAIRERTVVWTPNYLYPILPTNTNLLFINNDSLRLAEFIDNDYFTQSDIVVAKKTITGGSMLDNGNFVLYSSKGRVAWQSFDHPSDTLLPGQRLLTGHELVSRASETDLSKGIFRLKMQSDGNLVQYPLATSDEAENSYYSSGTYGAGDNLTLNLEKNGHLYLYNGSVCLNLTRGINNYTIRSFNLARVDPDGIFRLYHRSLQRKDSWTTIWQSTDDKCDPKGICGLNSLCTYDDEAVTCTCLPGFSAGCKVDINAYDCRNKNASVRYELTRIANVTWENSFYAINATMSEQDCGRVCLEDCDCVVVLFKEGACLKQTFPIRYGRRLVNDSTIALVKVPLLATPPPVQPPNANMGIGKGLPELKREISHLQEYVIIGLSVGIIVLITSSLIIYYYTRSEFCDKDEENTQNINKLVLNSGPLALKRYRYKEIKKVTKSFGEKLGQGAYGIVYKGRLPDDTLVAVKVLTKTRDNADEFLNEVVSISRTAHVNIVNLLGFCFEGRKRALVYEFMPNKSLDKYIYKRDSTDAECSLEWNKLYEIAVGVARGLEYLHRGCNTRIVHFDIKPQNILLDQGFCPKISDFGLAKLCRKKQSAISMLGTRGTIGYIAPEVYSRNFGLVSHKSDVYSFGIMLLQMSEARTNVETKSFRSSEDYFLEKVYERVLVQNEKMYAEISEEEERLVKTMLMVGFWCMQTAPSERPSMNKVVDMLEGSMQSIQIPPLPFLLSSPKPEFSCLLPVIVETKSLT